MSVRMAGALACVLASLPLVGHGQQPTPFRARVGVVVLHASVKNGQGDAVTTLDRGAFSVYENGKRQQITFFNRDDVPLSLGLVIDNSGSMRQIRSRVERAARTFVEASNPQDEMFVVNFADTPRLDVPLTTDLGAVQTGVTRVDAIGGTALRDAVDMAETHLRERASNDRKALVILSDGYDNASVTSMAKIQQAAERGAILVYAIDLPADPAKPQAGEGRHALEQLTKPTGGTVYFPAQADDIDSAVRDLARQIRSQYTLAYAPLNQALDGSYRTIRLQARGPGPGRLTVTTRAGYWATPW